MTSANSNKPPKKAPENNDDLEKQIEEAMRRIY